MNRWARRLAGTVAMALLVAGVLPAAAGDAVPRLWPSQSGEYRLGYRSRLQPLEINRMHAWELRLETAAGEPVNGAEFEVTGGMPAHDHGLPTQPRVTRSLGDGGYLLEGVRLHMHGEWEMTFRFSVAGQRDVVVIRFRL